MIGALRLADLDPRLAEVTDRTIRLQVLVDHSARSAGRCPTCRWAVSPTRPGCPSHVVALSLLENRPLPSWLAQLAGEVPGIRVRAETPSDDERRAAEDSAAGLFPAPRRVRPSGARP
ncbi:hypothetical protein ND486_09045 [Pseudonocardia sp. DR1-2]|uniref:hypothetical protein n=1 Tax=Pseudonocardia sp. DR1-2 TaxID=2951168 RepID=UPI002043FE77|nr:hypothetical protein [Pseudonocardia sp. DR1-2]MCM3846336.1 hypothetical protein [Pseudonocardia sp. DR1-2]